VGWYLALAAVSLLAQNDDLIAKHAAAASGAMAARDYAAAERYNLAIIELQPSMPEARTNLGLAYFLQKKYEPAVRSFEAGLKLQPGMANAWLFLGISKFHLNRPSEAVPALHKFTGMRPQDLQGQYFLGLSWLSLDEYSKAEQALRAAAAIDPKNIDVLYHLAQSFLGQARATPSHRDSLWPLYRKAVAEIAAIDPQSVRLSQLRAGYFEASGEKQKAIAELEGLLKDDPKIRGLHYTLGCLYMEALQYDKAVEQFEAEMLLDSPYPRSYLQLGHVYLKLHKPEKALPLLQRATAMEPKDAAIAWLEIARVHRSMNRTEESLAAFEKAVELGERTASTYYELAMEARKSGKHGRYQEALAISQRLREREKPQTSISR
jgi:tetratricopeptide (TPR) repeat protein